MLLISKSRLLISMLLVKGMSWVIWNNLWIGDSDSIFKIFVHLLNYLRFRGLLQILITLPITNGRLYLLISTTPKTHRRKCHIALIGCKVQIRYYHFIVSVQVLLNLSKVFLHSQSIIIGIPLPCLLRIGHAPFQFVFAILFEKI